MEGESTHQAPSLAEDLWQLMAVGRRKFISLKECRSGICPCSSGWAHTHVGGGSTRGTQRSEKRMQSWAEDVMGKVKKVLEVVWERAHDQNTMYACMELSKNKFNIVWFLRKKLKP